MTTGIVIFITIGIIFAAGYGGYTGGLFESLYGVLREFSAFLIAITFGLPLSNLLADTLNVGFLSEEYYELISFFLLIVVVFGLGRWLRTQYTVPVVRCVPGLNEAGGALIGALHGLIVTGIILVAWSMMPVAKYIPRDAGRVDPPAALDTGAMLLKCYGWVAEGMGGNDYIVYGEPLTSDTNGNGLVDGGEYKDLNQNGEWDPGLLWHYEHHADIRPNDVSGGIVLRPDRGGAPVLVKAPSPDSSQAPS